MMTVNHIIEQRTCFQMRMVRMWLFFMRTKVVDNIYKIISTVFEIYLSEGSHRPLSNFGGALRFEKSACGDFSVIIDFNG